MGLEDNDFNRIGEVSEEVLRDHVCSLHTASELITDLRPDPPAPDRNDPRHLLQTQRSDSLYTTCGSRHLRHETHTPSFLERSRATASACCSQGSIAALSVLCVPFHPVTLHHLKTDILTILPASYETLSARWEMTDLRSSRRDIIEGLGGSPHPRLATAALAERILSFSAQETEV